MADVCFLKSEVVISIELRYQNGVEILVDFDIAKRVLSLQEAQLAQRDRAAGCVIVFAKNRKLEMGDNILRTL